MEDVETCNRMWGTIDGLILVMVPQYGGGGVVSHVGDEWLKSQ